MQLLVIFLICGLFNFKIAFFSILIYILLGFIGLPIFSGFKNGASAILSPTGGFIIGFCFIPIIKLTLIKIKKTITFNIIYYSLSLIILYIIGFIWLGYFFKDYILALKFSLMFLPIDIIKALIAIKAINLLKKLNVFKQN
jgi:biotin transport system substrate-specific component